VSHIFKREDIKTFTPPLVRCTKCGDTGLHWYAGCEKCGCSFYNGKEPPPLTASRDQWKSDCVELAGLVEEIPGGNKEIWLARAKAKAMLERVKGDE
jgi:hypothetical protein